MAPTPKLPVGGVLSLLHRRFALPTTIQPAPASPILPRQASTTSTIPATYGDLDSDLTPGEVAGIVIGSVAGFVLILYILYMCINAGNPSMTTDETSSVVTRKSRRHSHNHHHHHAHVRPRSATVEIRTTTRGPVIVEPDEGSIIVEETMRRSRRSTSRGPVVREVLHSDDDGEDEVVVIEEAGSPPPPRPRRHRSSSVRRSVERRSSGYREVDPERFAGGDAPMREVRREGSRSRRRYS